MKHEGQTITYVVEDIILIDAAAPNPYHVLVSVLH
jgi:hypothetical protein